MSRTYRCRNLPIAAGRYRAYKIQDGVGRFGWRERREAASKLVEEILGPCPQQARKLVRGGFHHEYEYVPKPKNHPEWLLGPWYPHRHVKKPGHWVQTYEYWLWNKYLEEAERTLIVPVASWHPYQSTPHAGSSKKYNRVISNRLQRHRTKIILKTVVDWDEWDDHFPHKNETFSWWDIY